MAAAEGSTLKVALPPLPVTAYTAKQSKRRKKNEEEKRELKRQNDQRRNQARVNLGKSYPRWRVLRDRLGLHLDAKLAVILLDSYEKVTSTPIKPGKRAGKRQRSASSISSTSSSDGNEGVHELDWDVEEEVLQRPDARSISTTSLDLNTAEINEEVFNNISNATIDWLDSSLSEGLCRDGDSDFMPPLCVRSGGALTNNINIHKYDDITVEETVHDIRVMDEDEEEGLEEDESSSEAGLETIGQPASLVYHSCLQQLAEALPLPFSTCNVKDKYTSKPCQAQRPFKVVVRSRASAAVVQWVCSSGHMVWSWDSQPSLKNGLRIGDFLLSTNILLSGNSYAKIALLFKCMNVGIMGKKTYHKIQEHYCLDTIETFWRSRQKERLSRLKQKPHLVALGGGRMDRPGFCAKSCTYTMMEHESKEIISVESVDKRHESSSDMEKDAFIKSFDFLRELLPNLKEVCTDAHARITALFAKGKYSGCGILHTLDMWHGAEDLGKKIHKASQKKNCKSLEIWTKDICNHFWFCAKMASTFDDFFDMWRGVLHHVTGEHEWALGACYHAPLSDDKDKTLVKGSEAHEALTEIVWNEPWLRAVEKFLTFRSTSDLESFHNHILVYAGQSCSHKVYEARTFLAALDYNHHVHRPVRRNADGEVEFKKIFNKKSRQWKLFALKVEKDYSYITELQRAVLQSWSSSGRKRNVKKDATKT